MNREKEEPTGEISYASYTFREYSSVGYHLVASEDSGLVSEPQRKQERKRKDCLEGEEMHKKEGRKSNLAVWENDTGCS